MTSTMKQMQTKHAKLLRTRRAALGLTLREASRRWGYSESLISAVENGERTLSDGLAQAAGIQLEWRAGSAGWLLRNGWAQLAERTWRRGTLIAKFDGCDWCVRGAFEVDHRGTSQPTSRASVTGYGATPKSAVARFRDLAKAALGEVEDHK